MRWFRFSIVTTLVAMFLLGLAFVIRADDLKIIPGERIGDISLTMEVQDILKTLGTPSRQERSPTSPNMIYEWQNRRLRIFQSLNSGRVSDIRTYWIRGTQSPYRTEKGIRIASAVPEVRQAYGVEGCYVSEGSGWRNFGYRELGLFFVVWTNPGLPTEIDGRIAEIGVRAPTTTPPGPGNRPCT